MQTKLWSIIVKCTAEFKQFKKYNFEVNITHKYFKINKD